MELIARHGDREETVRLERAEAGYRVAVGEQVYDVDVAGVGDGVHSLLIAGRQFEVTVGGGPVGRESGQGNGGRYLVTGSAAAAEVELMDPLAYLARKAHDEVAAGGPQRVTAYMPGRVVEVLVEEGEAVTAGQGVLVLEAMKMKNEIQAEGAGTVRRILVAEGEAVEGGDPLFEIE